MGVLYQKLAVVVSAITVGFSLIWDLPVQATTLLWDLNFFDNAGNIVGGGEFTSEPNQTAIGVIRTPGPNNTVVNQSFEVTNYLTNFSANLLGRQWTDRSQPPERLTWLDSSLGTRQLRPGLRFGAAFSFILNNWEIGGQGGDSPFQPIRQGLYLEGNQLQANNVWGGSWLQRTATFNLGSVVVEDTGTWRATVRNQQSVLEPGTVLGIAAFGMGTLLLRRDKGTRG